MNATLRWYGGNTELADQLAARGDEIRKLIGDVPGVRAYFLVRTEGGTVSVTVADDEAGVEESNKVAASWLQANMPGAVTTPPQTSMGEVVLSL